MSADEAASSTSEAKEVELSDPPHRPSWQDYFVELVQIVRKRSACSRLQVGCILVNNNRMISAGYNGYLPGCPHESIMRDGHEMATIHAEQNAITDCARRGVSCEGSVAYITHYPCINCLKMLLASGIKKIYYINDYRNDAICKVLAEHAGVEIVKVDIKGQVGTGTSAGTGTGTGAAAAEVEERRRARC